MIDQRIEQALRAEKPVQELRNVALSLLADGQTREAIVELFEHARQELRQAQRDAEEDAVMDVMDLLGAERPLAPLWRAHLRFSVGRPPIIGPGSCQESGSDLAAQIVFASWFACWHSNITKSAKVFIRRGPDPIAG